MNSIFVYASTFHCYLYCESNFQLLDDKEYWTFIFCFNLKDCLLPYLVLFYVVLPISVKRKANLCFIIIALID